MDLLPLERITWVYQKEAGSGLLEFGLAASGVLSKRQAELARGVNAAGTTSLTVQAIGNPPVTISVLSLHLETFLVALLDRSSEWCSATTRNTRSSGAPTKRVS